MLYYIYTVYIYLYSTLTYEFIADKRQSGFKRPQCHEIKSFYYYAEFSILVHKCRSKV